MTEDTEAGETMTLRAGAGRAQIELPEELFPLEGFVGTHDPLHARAVVIDRDVRVVLVSVEMTSLPKEYVALLRESAAEIAGVAAENVWVCVTHTMSAPHVHWPGTAEAAAGPATPGSVPTGDDKNTSLAEGVKAAVRGATDHAMASLQEARLGHGSGPCDVNVNRDVPTDEGWWVGVNETGFSDKTLTVLRIEAMNGHPIAVLFSHCVRPAVIECQPGSRRDALVTADLAGATCAMVEKEYGDLTTALFLMGAAGDQAPRMPEDGGVPADESGGYVMAEAIGSRLGSEVVRLSEGIECGSHSEAVVATSVEIMFEGQEMPETRDIRPTKDHVFVDGEGRCESVHFISLGDVALVGASPELSCRTGVDIREGSPFPETVVVSMVNGAAKYMAERTAYERVTYESMNSPFARGSAERLADQAISTLRVLWDEARHGARH